MYRFYDHCCENIILKILQIIYFNTDMKAQEHVHVCSFVVLPSYWILGCILIVLWPTRNKEFSQYMCYIKGLKSTILNIYHSNNLKVLKKISGWENLQKLLFTRNLKDLSGLLLLLQNLLQRQSKCAACVAIY